MPATLLAALAHDAAGPASLTRLEGLNLSMGPMRIPRTPAVSLVKASERWGLPEWWLFSYKPVSHDRNDRRGRSTRQKGAGDSS